MPDDSLYSQTIDRTRGGSGWVNILGHDPLLPGEAATLPAMEPYKHFNTEEDASNAAADSAQKDYDKQRLDPSSQWYINPIPQLQTPSSTPAGPSIDHSLAPLNHLQELPGILSRQSRMQALQNSGGDFNSVINKTMTEGSFADAWKRQSALSPNLLMADTSDPSGVSRLRELAQLQSKQVNAPLPGEIGTGTYENRDLNAVRQQQDAQDAKMAADKKSADRLRRNKLMGLPLNTP